MSTEHPDSSPDHPESPHPPETSPTAPGSATPAIPMAVPVQLDDLATPPSDPDRPFSFWATIGLSVAVLVLLLGTQTILFVIAMIFTLDLDFNDPNMTDEIMQLAYNGQLLSWCTIVSTICCTGFFLLLLRVLGRSFRRYLALDIPPCKTILRWLLILIVFMIAEESLNHALGVDTVHEFMVTSYETAGSLVLLLIGIAIFAPFEEELIIRGFMFRGIAASRAGVIVAIVLPSALWTVIHVQYDLFILCQIFLFGILLGIARHRTKSTTVPIILHAFNNFVATIQVAIAVEYFGRTSS